MGQLQQQGQKVNDILKRGETIRIERSTTTSVFMSGYVTCYKVTSNATAAFCCGCLSSISFQHSILTSTAFLTFQSHRLTTSHTYARGLQYILTFCVLTFLPRNDNLSLRHSLTHSHKDTQEKIHTTHTPSAHSRRKT